MKAYLKSFATLLLVLSAITAKAQTYTCKGISRYQQLSSGNKYTHIGTVWAADTKWYISDSMMRRIDYDGEPGRTRVLKVERTKSGAKKYVLDLLGLTDGWIIVENGFVNWYEDNGVVKITYKIVKTEPYTEY